MLYAEQVKERDNTVKESLGAAKKKSETQKHIKLAKQRREQTELAIVQEKALERERVDAVAYSQGFLGSKPAEVPSQPKTKLASFVKGLARNPTQRASSSTGTRNIISRQSEVLSKKAFRKDSGRSSSKLNNSVSVAKLKVNSLF